MPQYLLTRMSFYYITTVHPMEHIRAWLNGDILLENQDGEINSKTEIKQDFTTLIGSAKYLIMTIPYKFL